MPDNKDNTNLKFSEEEMKKVKEIQQTYVDIQHRLGQISVAQIRLEQQSDAISEQKEKLNQQFLDVQADEKSFISSVTEKYGDGVLNPKTGIYSTADDPE